MRVCTKCKIEKPLEDFVRDARRAEGRGPHCLACRRKFAKENRPSRRKPKATGFSKLKVPPLSGRPLLLDLFCGAGGAAVGYSRAGFDVVGVDHHPMPNYPYFFLQADVTEFLDWHLDEAFPYALVHASPPCQKFTNFAIGLNNNADEYPDLVGITRAQLKALGKPWIMENVPNAPMRTDVTLCGSMFGLAVQRHRIFEASFHLPLPPACNHSSPAVGVYGSLGGGSMIQNTAKGIREASEAMGIDWMSAREIVEAVPPAYTEWLGAAWLATPTSPTPTG